MKKIIMVGSVGAGVILVLAMLTTVVNAQTEKSDGTQTNIFQYIQQLKNKIENKLIQPGGIIFELFIIVMAILYIIISGPAPF